MRIRNKVFCLIEGKAFFLYYRTVRYPAMERIAWHLYRKLFCGLGLLLRPFDKSDRLANQSLYQRIANRTSTL
jgi:hypothetical protein